MTDHMKNEAAAERVVVVGAGTMGAGIAAASVAGGFATILVDPERRALDRAQERIERHVPDGADRLRTSTDLGDVVATATLVIEAAPELLALKHELFGRIEALVSPEAVLASNTSTIPITAIAEACERPERVVGLHFFNPVHRMAIVEVIAGERTSDATHVRATAFAIAVGKEPISVRDSPGFVANRLGLLLGTEAMRIVEEGVADAADVDKATRLGFGYPMGPLQVADLVGLDARLNNLRSMHALTGRPEYRPPAILEDLVAEGRLGRKSGRGFYEYE